MNRDFSDTFLENPISINCSTKSYLTCDEIDSPSGAAYSLGFSYASAASCAANSSSFCSWFSDFSSFSRSYILIICVTVNS